MGDENTNCCYICNENSTNLKNLIEFRTDYTNNKIIDKISSLMGNSYVLHDHIQQHKMYNCRICKHPFSNYIKFKQHLYKCSNVDQFKIYKCSLCKIDFFHYVTYRKHILYDHKQNDETTETVEDDVTVSKDLKAVYICAKCSYETPHDAEMKVHIASHIQNEEYKCERCNSIFKTPHALELHSRRHLDGARSIKCNMCGLECVDKIHLRCHKKSVHKIHVTCTICKHVCRTKIELQVHIRQKHNGKLECDICKQTFTREITYKCHKEYSHRMDNKCKFCGKELTNLKELRLHEKRHKRRQGNTDFKCIYCEKILKTKTGLRLHLAKHTGEYKFFCEVCGRGCMSLMVLQEHMGVHTKEERYVCDVCGKKFCYNATYRIHRLWHDNPKPYDCPDCGQKFAHTSLLAVHRRREHTGERPYVCFGCNMTFTRSSSLKRHNRIHTGERPYVCIWCNRGFIEKKLWVKHLANEHDDYSEINNKPKCEYKMVIRPETEDTDELKKDEINHEPSTQEDMQQFIIIGNPNMENMILYGLPPQQDLDQSKDLDHSNTILLPTKDDFEQNQQAVVKFTVADSFQIIQDDCKSEQNRLLEGVDETNIVIKTDNGDMVIRNGQLVPLTEVL
ncbi:zinc finger protein 878-like [Chrysoperla carnea]|uniref:zinc finger protein 878-like n=1 Tax=Chrysoperla carnea TaxID=189513 RepID=UPI001D091030|nr:zinc finger protein 878-like [Chrysoperla carnea]